MIAILGCVLLGASLTTAAIVQGGAAEEAAVEERITALTIQRAQMLRNYLETIEQDLLTVGANPNTLNALSAFSDGWGSIPGDAERYLQQAYITDNPNPTGEKENLDFAPDGSAYSGAHEIFHPWFREFLRARGYYDIFLFNLEGDLVYSVFKELDYATNLNTGEYRDSDLGNAFRAAASAGQGEIAFFDFAPYAPSHGAPASFISTPVFDDFGERAGVLVFQMPVDRLNEVMGDTHGLGETGDAYAVGA